MSNSITMKTELIEEINQMQATIGVVGLGYVGLPLMKRLNEVGFKTIGLDIDQSKIDALTDGEAYIKHLDVDDITDAIKTGKSVVTTDFTQAKKADIIILCVPTPLNKYREPDLSYVIGSLETLLPSLRAGQMLSLESTTYPGTTEEELQPRIEAKNLTIGDDFFLIYSPEREDPGNPDFNTHTIPKVCGGITPHCLEVGEAFYSKIIEKVVPVSSTKAAEMTKILENTYRAVNIALVNELKVVADKMGIDIFEVIDAAATKPFGYKAFYPGPGLGGHCIPIDPFYLTWKAREYGLHTRFIELAGEVNTGMPEYVLAKLTNALNSAGKSVHGANILLLGVAYKKNVDDMRESPSVELLDKLVALHANAVYSDPHVPTLPLMRMSDLHMSSQPLTAEILQQQDAVVVATDHDAFDWQMIEQNSKIIIDTRGVYHESNPTVTRA